MTGRGPKKNKHLVTVYLFFTHWTSTISHQINHGQHLPPLNLFLGITSINIESKVQNIYQLNLNWLYGIAIPQLLLLVYILTKYAINPVCQDATFDKFPKMGLFCHGTCLWSIFSESLSKSGLGSTRDCWVVELAPLHLIFAALTLLFHHNFSFSEFDNYFILLF